MEPITFLEKYIIFNFENLLKNLEKKDIFLIKNGEYKSLEIFDDKGNKFEINIEYMIKTEGQNKFEINNKYYKQISTYTLRKIITTDASKKNYRELLTLCSYLSQYKIKVKNLKKCKSPDFFIEEENGKTYLIETFISKDNEDWDNNDEELEWSLSNSNEDINKINLILNKNSNINDNLLLIENLINNLRLERYRSRSTCRTWKFNYNEAFKSIDTHLKKLKKYKENNENINNLIFLIDMGVDKYIDKKDMEDFSQEVILKIKTKKYNIYNFKIKIVLINQLDKYDFYLN